MTSDSSYAARIRAAASPDLRREAMRTHVAEHGFVRVDALRWIVIQLEQEFTRYPVSIYSQGVRLLLTFVVPFAFMNYFPARFFLHKAHEASALPPVVGLFTPLIGIVAVTVAYLFWRLGLNKYAGVGH